VIGPYLLLKTENVKREARVMRAEAARVPRPIR
jgi:hypothetical protein